MTYQGFAEAWPSRTGDFADKFNGMRKYVVSTTLGEAEWNNTTVIYRDVVEEVSKLRQEPRGDILVNRSVQLVQALLAHGLVDELRLMVFPVVLGKGKRPLQGGHRRQAPWCRRAEAGGTGRRSHPHVRDHGRQVVGLSRRRPMPVDVLTAIEIDRPPEVVAAYAADPDYATSWYENIESVEWKTPPPLAVGSRIAFVARFLGRRLDYTYEVRELVPGARLVMSTADGPFAMETTYSWERAAGGTRMTLRNRGEPAGFSRVAAPLLARAMRRANRKDLEGLRSILENSEPALDATRWVLVELAGEPATAAATGHAPHLELEGGRVSGTGGCNRVTGTYETSEDTLRFGPLATTRMACEEAVMRRETAFLAALAATTRFEVAGSHLVLFDADRALARLEASGERS